MAKASPASCKARNEWKAPNKKTIVKCAVNQRQVVIALSGGELVYFEMDPVSLKISKLNILLIFSNDEHLIHVD